MKTACTRCQRSFDHDPNAPQAPCPWCGHVEPSTIDLSLNTPLRVLSPAPPPLPNAIDFSLPEPQPIDLIGNTTPPSEAPPELPEPPPTRDELFGTLRFADEDEDAPPPPRPRPAPRSLAAPLPQAAPPQAAPPQAAPPHPRQAAQQRMEQQRVELEEAASDIPTSPLISGINAPPPHDPNVHRPTPTSARVAMKNPDRGSRWLGLFILFALIGSIGYGVWTWQRNRGTVTFENFSSIVVEQATSDLKGLQTDATQAVDKLEAPELGDRTGGGDYYDQRVEVGPDGKKRIVLVPRNEAVPEATNKAVSKDGRVLSDRRPLGELKLPNPDGASFNLADHKGKVVILNIFATWCEPCREEIPDFARFYAKEGANGKDIEVYGVLIDASDIPAEVKKARRYGATYPLLLGDKDFERRFQLESIPTTLIIDADGLLVQRVDNPMALIDLDRAAAKARVGGNP